MSENTEKAPGKSKKMVLIGVIVAVLAVAAGGGWFYMSRQQADLDEDEEEVVTTKSSAQKGPPTFLPLDNMVVNLADPGGDRVAQVGVTLELSDAKATDKVKPYLPAIRSSVLMLVSQRKAEELLQIEGKEQLASDILAEASRHFGPPAGQKKKKSKSGEENPVRGVLFSNLIVQ